MFVRLALVALLCAAFAAPAGAAPVCGASARDLCQTARVRCERECSDLTTCVRRCCEAFQQCLSVHDCEIKGAACPK